MGIDYPNGQAEFYVQYEDGRKEKLSSLPAVSLEDLPDYRAECSLVDEIMGWTFGGYFRVSFCRRMTRRKFKKWLMGFGVCRNDAENLCECIKFGKGKLSYQEIYASRWFWERMDHFHVWNEIYERLISKGVIK